MKYDLGGDFKCFLIFIPILGEMIEFDEHISQMGCFNHQLVMFFVQLDSQESFKQINHHTEKKA